VHINPDFLDKLFKVHPSGTKEFAFYYLSFCCLFGYQKDVQGVLDKSEFAHLSEHLPNEDNCKPHFQLVKNKRDRDASMSSEGLGNEEKTQEETVN